MLTIMMYQLLSPYKILRRNYLVILEPVRNQGLGILTVVIR